MANRELLFRGKDSEGNWHKGDYHKNVVLNTVVHMITWIEVNENPLPTNALEDHPMGASIFGLGRAEIDPETLGQYTGFSDKNLNKIFEGDVLQVGESPLYTISMELGAFVAAKRMMYPDLGWYESVHGVRPYEDPENTWTGRLEIIGNIHDQPQLLEQ